MKKLLNGLKQTSQNSLTSEDNIIIFTNSTEYMGMTEPILSSLNIPEWYKKTPSYMDGEKTPDIENHMIKSTIKKCMPVFDVITAGYLLLTPVDVYVRTKDNQPFFQWPSFGPIDFHNVKQAEFHPISQGVPFAKWMNPWSIKTPPGYSCLFMHPAHRDLPFTILPGIVDTDTYTPPVNFPFVLNDVNWEGLIPAGTPMAQVIPIKRDNWGSKIGGEEDLQRVKKDNGILVQKFSNRYKSMFWTKKTYK